MKRTTSILIFLFASLVIFAQETRTYGKERRANTEFDGEWTEIGGGCSIAEGYVNCDLIRWGAVVTTCDVLAQRPKDGEYVKVEMIYRRPLNEIQITTQESCSEAVPAAPKKGKAKKKTARSAAAPPSDTLHIKKHQFKIRVEQ